jgi:hypothetical protein
MGKHPIHPRAGVCKAVGLVRCGEGHPYLVEWCWTAVAEQKFAENGRGTGGRRTVPERGSAIAVVGSGYVGTVVAACFAWLGRMVVAVEADGARIGR